MITTQDQSEMQPGDDTKFGGASTQASNRPLNRLRRAVMSRLFDDASQPETLGRYQIERAIGSGGMGVVYAAYDPELDRRVAVKLLHYTDGEAEGKRLLREAKGLARLSHTNVVQVHDAGTVDDRVFLAMELVSGGDLRRWLGAEPRGWQRVVGAFIDAGEGLAAAHAAGLVHRDFKPENILVREDGVVKVADFGLVRAADAAWTVSSAGPSEVELDAAVESLTRPGASVGTPAYMSPEQHLALPTDTRTDQFSFCVALYEGIYGVVPFRADTLRGLIEAARADHVEFPRQPKVPGKLKAVIARGLRANPDHRYPDMPALLAGLRRIDAPGRHRGPIVAGAAFGLAALMATGSLPAPAETDSAPALVATDGCDPQGKVEAVWNDAVRATIEQRLQTSLPQVGTQAAATAQQEIDAYLRNWVAAYGDTCRGGAPSDGQGLAKQLCLQSRLDEARGVISVLARADATIVPNTAQIVAALEPIDECLGALTVVRTASASSPELNFELARARSLWHAKHPAEAYAAAESLAQRARTSGDRTIEADAWLLAGTVAKFEVLDDDDAVAHTRDALQRALGVAESIGDARRILRAEVLLAATPQDDKGTTALADLQRLGPRVEGSNDAFARWAYHFDLSFSFVTTDAVAREQHAKIMFELANEHFGPGHRLVELSERLAQHNGIVPRPTAAQQVDKATAVAGMFGASSPRAVEEQMRLAGTLLQDGKVDEARAKYDQAVVAWTELEGPTSTQVGGVWRAIAALESDRGDDAAALEAWDHALVALAANPVVDHKGENDVLSAVWFGRAETLLNLERPAEAVAAIERGKRLRHPDEDGDFELWGDTFGRAKLAVGEPKGALAEYAAARASYGLDDPTLARWQHDEGAFEPPFAMLVAPLLAGEAQAYLAAGDVAHARTLAELAWARFGQQTGQPGAAGMRARTGLALAQVLAVAEPDSPRIQTIAVAALAAAEGPEGDRQTVATREALAALATR